MKKILLGSTICCFLLTSCATVFTGTKDRITFNSTPSGALVFKDGVELCRTPCSAKIKRKFGDTDIEFKLDGYETRILTLDKEFNLVSIINLGSLVGWGIDALSGSIMKYDRKSYDVTLNKQKTSKITPNRIDIDTKEKKVDVYVYNK